MRILFVSYYFPPFNSVAAVRTGKSAACLLNMGHDVRVLTARDTPFPPELEIEFPADRVTATAWCNVNRPVELALGGRRAVARRGFVTSTGGRSPLRSLGGLYKTLFNFPDGQVGWYPFALGAGARMIRSWRPDVLLVSAPPMTALHVTACLARKFDIPWVADLRDLGVDGHYYRQPQWRERIERRWEQRSLASAAGLATVSEPLAETLRARYAQPVAVVLNGYDPADFPTDVRPVVSDKLTIAYTGRVYDDKQDVAPLLTALSQLGPDADCVRVAFYGRYLEGVRAAATRHGVSHCVEVHPPVPFRESLRIQSEADALLLLLWNDPAERGVYTGKLFEYIGSRRPILAIGAGTDVAADLIRDRRAGVVLQSPEGIAVQLRAWLDLKARVGGIEPNPAAACAGLTRDDAARSLEQFLKRLVPGDSAVNAVAKAA